MKCVHTLHVTWHMKHAHSTCHVNLSHAWHDAHIPNQHILFHWCLSSFTCKATWSSKWIGVCLKHPNAISHDFFAYETHGILTCSHMCATVCVLHVWNTWNIDLQPYVCYCVCVACMEHMEYWLAASWNTLTVDVTRHTHTQTHTTTLPHETHKR